MHVYSSYICIPRFRSRQYISAAIPAASLDWLHHALPIRCIFFTARSSFYHRFRFRFPVFFPRLLHRAGRSVEIGKTDGGLMAVYRTGLIVHSYDNLDGKFARKNVCCNLKSLYHRVSSSSRHVQFNFYFILTQSDRVNLEYYKCARCLRNYPEDKSSVATILYVMGEGRKNEPRHRGEFKSSPINCNGITSFTIVVVSIRK